MKRTTLSFWISSLCFLASCQTAAPTPLASTPTPPGQVETRVAATIFADQTSTAEAAFAQQATLTAAIPSATNTPGATPTQDRIHVVLPANACWMNSEVNVRTGQSVLIRAFGTANTWDGRDGSSGDPKGQPGKMCGAIQCPLQGADYGALIARIEDGETFLVGAGLKFVAAADGQLFFTINDWECTDNSGYFDILITFP